MLGIRGMEYKGRPLAVGLFSFNFEHLETPEYILQVSGPQLAN